MIFKGNWGNEGGFKTKTPNSQEWQATPFRQGV